MQFLPMADLRDSVSSQKTENGDVIDFASLADALQSGGDACCGGPPPPRSNPYELAGYLLQPYVKGMLISSLGDVPVVETSLGGRDFFGAFLTRLGITRNKYLVSPGLYGIGKPDRESPVIVTANYKLTFDAVRKELGDVDCWLLVLDTCGINVWCAAGKKTFSTDEIVRQVENTQLAERVSHKRLIVPQLGATGVSAHQVRMKCGFKVVYGPIKASDLPVFLKNFDSEKMKTREVTFSLWERMVLIPVEGYLFGKKIWWLIPVLFFISGISRDIYTVSLAWQRGIVGCIALLLGTVIGAVVVPLLLPWIPGRAFSFKGFISGIIGGLLLAKVVPFASLVDGAAFVMGSTAVSSYLAMNFTGSTPYTSPSGVEKEMKIAIPLLSISVASVFILWIIGGLIVGG